MEKYTYKGHKIEITERRHTNEAGQDVHAGFSVVVTGPVYSLNHHTYSLDYLNQAIERDIDAKLAAKPVRS